MKFFKTTASGYTSLSEFRSGLTSMSQRAPQMLNREKSSALLSLAASKSSGVSLASKESKVSYTSFSGDRRWERCGEVLRFREARTFLGCIHYHGAFNLEILCPVDEPTGWFAKRVGDGSVPPQIYKVFERAADVDGIRDYSRVGDLSARPERGLGAYEVYLYSGMSSVYAPDFHGSLVPPPKVTVALEGRPVTLNYEGAVLGAGNYSVAHLYAYGEGDQKKLHVVKLPNTFEKTAQGVVELNSEIRTDTNAAMGLQDQLSQTSRIAVVQDRRDIYLPLEGKPWSFLMVVEPLLSGETVTSMVAKQVKANEKMPLDGVLELINELKGLLDYMHSKGLYHRDVQPENVLYDPLAPEGRRVRLIDLGKCCDYPGADSEAKLMWNYGPPDYSKSGHDFNAKRFDNWAVGSVGIVALCGRDGFRWETELGFLKFFRALYKLSSVEERQAKIEPFFKSYRYGGVADDEVKFKACCRLLAEIFCSQNEFIAETSASSG